MSQLSLLGDAAVTPAEWGEPCPVCGWCATPGACVWSVPCPECGAPPQAQCRRPGGLVPLHRARWDACG